MEINNTRCYNEWPRENTILVDKEIRSGCFGCSHTWGTGVEYNQAWPWLLNSHNFGFTGGSINFISRNILKVINEYSLEKIYILYPSYTRFEYEDNGIIFQSLPTDPNRHLFKIQNSEEWLLNNYRENKFKIKSICQEKNVKLVDLDFEELHKYIDYPDRWPMAKDGSHFGPQWHIWVAEIFKNHEKT